VDDHIGFYHQRKFSANEMTSGFAMHIPTLKRKEIWAAVAALAVALFLRLISLQSRGIWYDDSFSIFLSEGSYEHIIEGTAADTMPPLYYFLLHLWMIFGHQIWWLRLLNVSLSLVTVGMVYVLGTDLFGKTTGLLAGFFTAISPLQIYQAQELRMYVVLTLSLLGYLWFFVRISSRTEPGFLAPLAEPPQNPNAIAVLPLTFRQDWPYWLGLLICGAAAMYSHNLAVFTLIAPTIFLVLRKRWRLLVPVLLTQLTIGIFAIPWLRMIPGQIAKIQAAFWTPRPGLVEIIQAITTFHSNLPLPSWLLPVSIILSFQVVIMVMIETFRGSWREERVVFSLAVVVIPPALLFLASYLMRPVFVPRALMLSSLFYYLLLARVIVQGRARGVGLFLAGAYTLLALLALPYQYSFDDFPRSPFKQLTAALANEVGPDDLVLHDNKLSYFPAHFYAPDLFQCFLPDEPGSHNDTLALASQDAMGIHPVSNLQEGIQDRSAVWFVVFEEAIQEYRDAGQPDHPVILELESQFDLVGTESFNDLLVYEFVR
jgi:mannosyltransferase